MDKTEKIILKIDIEIEKTIIIAAVCLSTLKTTYKKMSSIVNFFLTQTVPQINPIQLNTIQGRTEDNLIIPNKNRAIDQFNYPIQPI